MTINLVDYPLLANINSPDDLRMLDKPQLTQASTELRSYLLSSVSKSSGHFASGLGTIELTVALHYVYKTPFDHLVWDVGHQAYPHKILTGRRDQLHTIRQKDGLHPFPWREESEYDVLSVGHSSTSISAALGMAVAAEKEGKQRKVVAVIGDGAMTAGMAFEALNHAGDIKSDMLVILNDNEMSISENVGALNNHFAKLLSGSIYTGIREGSKRILKNMPPIKELASRAEEHLKGMVVPSTFFEELGFNYIGPIDGHDVNGLVDTISNMRNLKGPQILHIATKKGKGYYAAEQDPIKYHAVPKFDPTQTSLPKSKPSLPTYSKIFGDWLCKTAEKNESLIAITPAMGEGSGMVEFSQRFPKQYFDVAIAEQHAVTFAAGLAIGGKKPVVAIYSSFLQRGYDQLIHDVAIQNLPVLFAIDRAGIVGADGPTHQGSFDLSFIRCVPNMVIMAPSDERECQMMLTTGFKHDGPVAVRYPRGSGNGATLPSIDETIEMGKARKIIQAVTDDTESAVAILNFGSTLDEAQIAAQQLNATLVDMRFIKPLDSALIDDVVKNHTIIVTVEDNAIAGGAGSGVNEYILSQGIAIKILNIGLPDSFIKHGTQQEIHQELGLDSQGIIDKINAFRKL
ncbi:MULTISPECIES: 1-deoxy-D-xylulose-5-phosphate synthase [unclassified Colwellia]|uniref:1-deoxy-D-xylulose-5-phosphate synthase n=1 Tax=unclassified Colwellia TaxID=196834 RepID=UPI0015F42DE4|nr:MULTISPECIES: 1-deoxy-D-xylulose-5-phosphate synthase [unclassified Colwellia]MBA6230655.1 1-deoxy-D-xylulose-5-phosphate synthase [Colwellia sp. MB02u-7]MBA6234586.1 1-deoxy-D-xylulose-5-phosphate synthase [Colwellia sp. MB02u-11]MBA6255450.1 1-deoxy-D-xylulose-5-phosphate synthase [Colwellia sp. MB3u-28]MBA6261590.1 1-deoxy-D-xylulose-5-phosphate synthase [Colwellia sp. MB3u-41]MBA6301140.1 1-deoxy-D-xylulose-5-phosphate synthase [Colwellia sp. MB3u-22]